MDIKELCNDTLTIARCLVAQGCIYYDLYDFDNYTQLSLKAAELYKRTSRKDDEFSCLLYALNGATIASDKELADSINNILTHYNAADADSPMLLAYRLPYIETFSKESEIKDYLNSIPENYKFNVDEMLSLASAQIKLGDDQKAEMILTSIKSQGEPYDTMRYQACLVNLLIKQNRHEEALDAYMKFSRMSSLNKMAVFQTEGKSIADKHRIEISAIKERNRKNMSLWLCLLGITVLTLVIATLLIAIRGKHIKEELARERATAAEAKSENLLHRVKTLEEEQQRLKDLLTESNELPDPIREIVRHRINMLNSHIASKITSISMLRVPYKEWEDSLNSDKERFMNENREGFDIMYPEIIRHLQEKNLTEKEINYMCLYALGLNGTEIGKYLEMPSYRNRTKEIRKKLGLGIHDSNLDIYMRNLLKEAK